MEYKLLPSFSIIVLNTSETNIGTNTTIPIVKAIL